ncbi:TIGR04211 family SH3 domain-containing protein [Thiomicrorhabdus sp. ZW0627]|uniref:TIGR04211 family SH3 domain-containing protein n=1 Tax=Thiomicrorhabdus sp. ZW0627 TaxID=3039774 RepID=UPI0024370C91|nr:TIGR04211 family SH3 domain-containing protein [Thiomicrorhabdus sp. ZW0627]MDG6773549.1 TIGR04211 family SH3 domain-containing protein [Thiomicrorhabdus sp. ZW0627]
MKRSNSYKSLALIPALLIGAVVTATPASAVETPATGSTRYITDTFEVPMRTGASHKHRITRMLKSGTSVKLLEVDESGWAKIEYRNSIGWMPSSMLENQPIAKDRLEVQIKKTTSVEAKYNDLKQELTTLQTRFNETSSELKTVKQEKFETTQELTRLKEISSNAVQLDQQNQEMKARLSRLEDENAIMREQIDQSEDAIKRQWFLTGGGVLLLGLLLGRFFRVPKKRQKWGEI